MSWTYSGDPASSDRDEVRFLIGDTDANNQLLSDEELDYLIATNPDQGSAYSNYKAAAQASLATAAKFSQLMDKTVGSLSIRYSQKQGSYIALAERLMTTATSGLTARKPGVPVIGGSGTTYLGGNWR